MPEESGYYWFYTILSDGVQLESDGKPSICWYSKERQEIDFIGYDVPLPYDPAQYRLIKRVQYE